jgi:hypothetical protein
MQNIPETVSGWFQFSKGDKNVGSRSEFFEALPSLTEHSFTKMIKTAIEPVDGELRSLRNIREEGRKAVPSEANLLQELKDPARHSEQRLQYLLWHRQRLLEHQTIIAREVPCSFTKVCRPAVADFLSIDTITSAPIIVEVKCGTATDSLTGALFQLLDNWCFHKSAWGAFLSQLQHAGYVISSQVTQPEAVLVAPLSFYEEVVRRSEDRRRWNEARHAKRFLGVMEATFGLKVRFVRVGSNWPQQGKNLCCNPYTLTI